MATNNFPALPEDKLRTVDQLRQRLNQLSTSLGSLKVDLERNEPLPSWPSLQSSAQIVSHNLGQLMSTFESHREFLNTLHAYPLTTFPAQTQEGLLNQLLRKRLDPSVEDWIKQHDTSDVQPGQLNGKLDQSHVDEGMLREMWSSAGPASNAVVRRMIDDEAFDSDFTQAEREAGIENVITGLRRKLWEDDSEDDGDEKGDKMEDIQQPIGEALSDIAGYEPGKQPLQVEQVLRFMSTGRLPV